ncbi:uncharacterized protein BDZ99DRAFT_528491 [Mytilinidion resinicola]|uniref:Uncharacterized protein n=1 Tax=Mytilinidion resinicola TaxID=574789 RepID=A0A6A6XXV6_9PEZI|nr:uncharacterized protein BDZ99DRAFT_528491 [Mytilinidion resinicola]KAF2801381.1 hypothetical protein BDZ99DRAFT_528491 [Mytilinidion resinicola]
MDVAVAFTMDRAKNVLLSKKDEAHSTQDKDQEPQLGPGSPDFPCFQWRHGAALSERDAAFVSPAAPSRGWCALFPSTPLPHCQHGPHKDDCTAPLIMAEKRIQLSLELKTTTSHAFEKVTFHDTGKTKLVERPNASSGTASISLTTKPYEYRADRTIDGKALASRSSLSKFQKKNTTYDTSQL